MDIGTRVFSAKFGLGIVILVQGVHLLVRFNVLDYILLHEGGGICNEKRCYWYLDYETNLYIVENYGGLF